MTTPSESVPPSIRATEPLLLQTGEQGRGWPWSRYRWARLRGIYREQCDCMMVSRLVPEQIGETDGRDIVLSFDDNGPLMSFSDEQLRAALVAIGCPWVKPLDAE